MINVKWFGHSMWKVWDDETSIIIDPFSDIGYQLPTNESSDLILSSHDHHDHNNFSLIQGKPLIFNNPGNFKFRNTDISNLAVWHDETEGSQRGKNLLLKFTLAGKTFLHCGDLGHIPSDRTLAELGKIDVIFIPIGGFYTIDASQAKELLDIISPTIVFPMHYKTAVLDFPISDEKPFQKLIHDFTEISVNHIQLDESHFKTKQVFFLNYV